jgi:serine phosphatase RsbU (regulator of sigma subunit)
MTDSYPDVLSGMYAARPEDVFTVMRAALAAHQLQAQLWLVDYQQTTLCRANDAAEPARVGVTDSVPGRVFISGRRAVVIGDGTVVVYVPVNNHGARLGILQLQATAVPSETALTELADAAEVLGRLLAAAGRFTDHFEQYRRSRPFTLAAEIQWALLPAPAHVESRFSVAGMLEPAYSVAGDAYDWSINADTLTIAVCDGTRRGVPASLATALCLTALRNARLARVSLRDQAALADQALFAHFSGGTYVAASLIQLDLTRGRAVAIDAGSPLIYRVRGGYVTKLALEAELPLGMFDESKYREQELDAVPGDRLVVVSDGVHGATGTTETFGTMALSEAIAASANASPQEATRLIIGALHQHHSGDLDDDAVVLTIDWHPSPA